VVDTISGLVIVDIVTPPAGATYPTAPPARLPAMNPYFANLPAPTISDSAIVVFADWLPATPAAGPSQLDPTQFSLGSYSRPLMRFNPESLYVPSDSAGTALPMLLGQTQRWRIENRDARTGINHPFHIHINPFQVDSVVFGKGDPNAPLYRDLNAAARGGHPIWLDVLPLPAAITDAAGNYNGPGVAYIRQQYRDFTGEFVMHCHILGHEERGMMQLLAVDSTPAAARARRTRRPLMSHSGHPAPDGGGKRGGGGDGGRGGGASPMLHERR
jgi:hypothetical protein